MQLGFVIHEPGHALLAIDPANTPASEAPQSFWPSPLIPISANWSFSRFALSKVIRSLRRTWVERSTSEKEAVVSGKFFQMNCNIRSL